MKARVTMRKALHTSALLGAALEDASWYGWRVLLIAAAGERLTDEERKEFTRLTGRAKEPGKMVKEFIAVAGRRSGKSFAMACFLVWIAGLCDHTDALGPGELGIALCISRDQRIAKVILNYVEGIITASPLLKSLSNCRSQSRSSVCIGSSRPIGSGWLSSQSERAAIAGSMPTLFPPTRLDLHIDELRGGDPAE
jgi:hypothetical protein